MVKFLRAIAGLKIKTQIGLIIAVLLVPLAFVTYLLVDSKQKDIAFAQLELQGNDYAKLAWQGVLSAAKGDASGLGDAAARLKAASKASDPLFGSADAVAAFLKGAEAGTGPDTVAAGLSAVQKIADGSNLTLDPDLDTFYLMDLGVVRIPELAAATADVNAALAPYRKAGAGLPDFQRLVEAKTRLTVALSSVQNSLGSAIAGNADKSLEKSLAPAGNALVGEAQSLATAITSLTAELAAGKSPTAGTIRTDPVFGQIATASAVTYAELPRLLEARVKRLQGSLILELGLAGAAAVLALALSFFMVASIKGPISDLVETLRYLQAGKFDTEVKHTEKQNEIGLIARAILRAQETGSQAALTVDALNQSPTMLMITDPNERIMFVSQPLTNLLMELEPTFRAHKKDFSVETMEGQHVDYYRANPALRRELLLDDGKSRKVRYEVGGATIMVDMSYIFDIEGRKIGHALVWYNITAELAGQVEVAAVVNAAQAGDFSGRLSLDEKSGFVRDIASGLNNVS
jgi:HAMP domain-containing protein